MSDPFDPHQAKPAAPREVGVRVENAPQAPSESLAERVKQRKTQPFWRSQFVQIVLGGIGGLLIATPVAMLVHSRGCQSEPAAVADARPRAKPAPRVVPPARREPAPELPAPAPALPAEPDFAVVELPPDEPVAPVVAPVAEAPQPPSTLPLPEPAGEPPAPPPLPVEPVAPPVKPGKPPVPSEAEQKEAEQKVRELLKDELAAATTPETNLALIRHLVKLSTEAGNDLVLRYVLLHMAEERACDAGQLALAIQAVDPIANTYDVDGWSLRIAVLDRVIDAAHKSRGTIPFADAEVASAMALGNRAATEDAYPAALQIADTLVTAARRAKNAPLARQLAKWKDEIAKQEKGFAAYQKVRAEREADASNAEAALAVGRWLAYEKGRWDEALPHLAAGSDAALAQVAEHDLTGPAEPATQLLLADSWWQQSQRESGPARSAAARRAVHWFDQALPKLTGLSKLTAEKSRLEALSTIGDPNASAIPGAVEEGNVALSTRGAKLTGTNKITKPECLLDGVRSDVAYSACPFEWTIVLDKVYRLQEIRLYLYATSKFSYQYAIAVSSDGANFSPLDERTTSSTAELQQLTFPARAVKAIRLIGLSSTYPSNRVLSRELEAYCIPVDVTSSKVP